MKAHATAPKLWDKDWIFPEKARVVKKYVKEASTQKSAGKGPLHVTGHGVGRENSELLD